MNKNLTIVVGIVILLLIGLGGWWLMSSKGSAPSTSEERVAQPDINIKTAPAKTVASGSKSATQAGGGSKNTFGGIFAQPGNHECKYAYVDRSIQHNDVIYIADGKMRGEFRAIGGVADLMVFDGTYLYSWKEGQSLGTKTKLTSISQLPNAIPKDLTSGAVYGTSLENVSRDCHAWIKNASLLRAPSYVKF